MFVIVLVVIITGCFVEGLKDAVPRLCQLFAYPRSLKKYFGAQIEFNLFMPFLLLNNLSVT